MVLGIGLGKAALQTAAIAAVVVVVMLYVPQVREFLGLPPRA